MLRHLRKNHLLGFTMIEVMVVLGIAAMLLAMAVPFVGGLFNENPIRDTTKNVMKLLEQARAQSILSGQSYEFVVSPENYSISIRPSAHQKRTPSGMLPDDQLALDTLGEPPPLDAPQPKELKKMSMQIHEEIIIEMIAVNYIEMKDFPEAVVRFHPNGTSDKFTFIFKRQEDEYRLVRLDMMTALADFETDYRKFNDALD